MKPLTILTKAELIRRLEATQEMLTEIPAGEADTQRLVHELQVHQIELEVQNRDLKAAQEELVVSHARYVELYDRAPVGYLTLDRRGWINAVNRTGAEMLGREIDAVRDQPFPVFLPRDYKLPFFEHVRAVFSTRKKQVLEVRIEPVGAEPMDVRLESIPVLGDGGELKECHTAMVDITSRVIAEEERLRRERELRNILVREVHHRIKNQMQQVMSLLRAHVDKTPALKSAIEAAIEQVRAVVVIHGLQTRGPDDGAELWALAAEIGRGAGERSGLRVVLHPASRPAPAYLKPQEVVPMALVINELVHNAVKHAKSLDGNPPTLVLEMRRERNRARLVVTNPAEPLPEDFGLGHPQALGDGLTLTSSLMPEEGAGLSFACREVPGGHEVGAELVLEPPVIQKR